MIYISPEMAKKNDFSIGPVLVGRRSNRHWRITVLNLFDVTVLMVEIAPGVCYPFGCAFWGGINGSLDYVFNDLLDNTCLILVQSIAELNELL